MIWKERKPTTPEKEKVFRCSRTDDKGIVRFRNPAEQKMRCVQGEGKRQRPCAFPVSCAFPALSRLFRPPSSPPRQPGLSSSPPAFPPPPRSPRSCLPHLSPRSPRFPQSSAGRNSRNGGATAALAISASFIYTLSFQRAFYRRRDNM